MSFFYFTICLEAHLSMVWCRFKESKRAKSQVQNQTSLLVVVYIPSWCTLQYGMESVGMNGQTDWQAQQISHLVCSLAGQRCSEAWGTFSARTSQSITALTAWRKEEWRKEAADIPPSKAENDLCSIRQILALLRGQPWGDCWETGRSAYGPFRALRCHLELKLKLKLKERKKAANENLIFFFSFITCGCPKTSKTIAYFCWTPQ